MKRLLELDRRVESSKHQRLPLTSIRTTPLSIFQIFVDVRVGLVSSPFLPWYLFARNQVLRLELIHHSVELQFKSVPLDFVKVMH